MAFKEGGPIDEHPSVLGHKELQKDLFRLRQEKKTAKAELDMYSGQIEHLIHKYIPEQTFSLEHKGMDESGRLLWELRLHGEGHLKGGQESIAKEMKGYIEQVYKKLELFLGEHEVGSADVVPSQKRRGK